MKMREVRKLKYDEQEKRLKELKLELLKERGNVEMGGNVKNPGRIKTIRRDIARLLTIENEREKTNE
ncbi:MAG: 50S ribosomal protein L29 [Candidatus Aenigmarchaeota archaeon CG_4_10_14_0_8_um_filter_37_24]|nr:50S ribosomal protein L29 [Candidatus Aenigmarchaeota archaeon]OIN86568.1 MAG: 50S ribosomal protein L29 [Candidatus Aenigmarchaeota archaeon CG1_02_38_14]PIV69388.1 MAG: 50S ribosomal protein L29 [Candidatus Aenigmarchaeota archaeon CG01_land_8_20_14_3_00_37_9]PIW41703.1 MAG: 50S ribosomal protein L29 [Candidatus Aenigmarchaeota archaeon CG15_BIG_FIL_POST_REV_8_21_14_020_37_27]PIX50551.1 MAG: 50S ribosomal protein L29 [Candidatus Aenigmarchaeota archaeon CG_4_8_14_3_um_filter_37_24]PIY3490